LIAPIALRHKSPGPGTHSPITGFTEPSIISKHAKEARPVFGKDARRPLEFLHKRFVDNPGPGKYERVGEIGEYTLSHRSGNKSSIDSSFQSGSNY